MERIKQQLQFARKQREQLQHGQATAAGEARHRKQNANGPYNNRFVTLKDINIRFLLVTAALIVLVMILWWGMSGKEPGRIRLSDGDLLESHQTSAAGSLAVENLEVRITALVKHLDVLTESISHLESKLASAHLMTDTLIQSQKELASSTSFTPRATSEAEQALLAPPSADTGQSGRETSVAKIPGQTADAITTGQPDKTAIDTATSIESYTARMPDSSVAEPSATPSSGAGIIEDEQSSTRPPETTATSKLTVMEGKAPVADVVPTVSPDKNGPWVINLVSTSSKADADRLVKKALSRDIQTQQQQITVKGTQYWRVQIIGFSTQEQANAYADIAKEKLGLKAVWIMKR